MKTVLPDDSWPELWLNSYHYDQLEVYGNFSCRGYTYAYSHRQRHALELVEKYVVPGSTIIDIAAAQGNFSLLLSERGYRVTWNDLREELIDYVKLKQESDLNYLPGNVFELQVEQPFDAVLITEIIEHVAHPDQFLKKVASLIKPGGIIVMTTPNGQYLRNTLPKFSNCPDPSLFESGQFKPDADGHIFLLHTDEVNRLGEAAGLKLEELRFFVTPLTNGHMKSELILKVLPEAVVDCLERMICAMPSWITTKVCLQLGAAYRKI